VSEIITFCPFNLRPNPAPERFKPDPVILRVDKHVSLIKEFPQEFLFRQVARFFVRAEKDLEVLYSEMTVVVPCPPSQSKKRSPGSLEVRGQVVL